MNIMIRCSCGSEEIEFFYDENTGTLDMSMWELGHRGKMSFFERVRWCWHILTTGAPWTDYIILDKDGIKKLKDYVSVLPE